MCAVPLIGLNPLGWYVANQNVIVPGCCGDVEEHVTKICASVHATSSAAAATHTRIMTAVVSPHNIKAFCVFFFSFGSCEKAFLGVGSGTTRST